MAFYRPDPAMAARLEVALDGLDADGRPGLRNSLAITWVRYDDAAPEVGRAVVLPGTKTGSSIRPAW